jgi:AAA+ ATPase superfamily predicted ATPase
MSTIELFPLRIAIGERFCNRVEEKFFLKQCIEQQKPTVLISPRRYGKTSLAYKVVDELQYPFCTIDFLTAYDDHSICMSIIKGVSELVSKIMPINMKTVKFIEKCFHGVKVAIASKRIELEFTMPIERLDPVLQVLETLKGLEELAAKLDMKVVIFIDEFQQILAVSKSEAIQGSIRHVAQMAKHVAFLFSGSSRHMLSKIFEDSHLPLYMMCEKLYLGRIESAHYLTYIQEAAQIKWKEKLSDHLIERIFVLTENHPFYVNFLCGKLWKKHSRPLHRSDIDTAWNDCLLDEERRLVLELERLTQNQRVILKAIANASELKEPTATAFLSPLGLASGTVVPILKALAEKDLIVSEQHGVTKVIDPLLKYMLLM